MTRPNHISFGNFDLNLLPKGCRKPGSPAFEDAIRQYFLAHHAAAGQLTCLLVKKDHLEAYTFPDEEEALGLIGTFLRAGKLQDAVSMLESLTKGREPGATVLYNLGIAYAELKQYDEAVLRLRKLVAATPDHTHGWVGLGNALQALGRKADALEAYARAVECDPEDGFAQRNLGGGLMMNDRKEEAVSHLRRALELLPDDERAHFGLGLALFDTGSHAEADPLLKEFLKKHPGSPQAEEVRQMRSKIAHGQMRRQAPGGFRMDVVMYMVGAFQKIEKFRKKEKVVRTQQGRMVLPSVHAIAMEVALKGQTGLDINDAGTTYSLKSLEGTFTGLHLLALMYVMFKEIDPSLDVGVDFKDEYKAAQDFYKHGKSARP